MKGKSRLRMVVSFAAALALVCVSALPALAANKLIVKDATGTTDKFVVTDSGTVGVGTNAPAAGVYVKGSTYPNNTIKVEGNDVTGGAGFLGYSVRSGSLPLAADRLGFFLFGSVSGATAYHAAGMEAVAEANWTTTSTPAYFTIATTPTGTTGRYERVRVTSAGNVGIGTSTPGQKLEVNGGIRVNTTATQPTCNSAARGTIWYTNGAVGVKDSVQICAKDAAETYAWRTIY